MSDRRPWCKWCQDYTDHESVPCKSPSFPELADTYEAYKELKAVAKKVVENQKTGKMNPLDWDRLDKLL